MIKHYINQLLEELDAIEDYCEIIKSETERDYIDKFVKIQNDEKQHFDFLYSIIEKHMPQNEVISKTLMEDLHCKAKHVMERTAEAVKMK